jgi:signal peptidase I
MSTSGLIFEKVRSEAEIQHKIHPTLKQEIIEYVLYFLRVLAIVTIVFVTIRTQIYQVTSIEGSSMYPSLQDKDIVFIDLLTPKFGDYRRGDIVVVKPPGDFRVQNTFLIKRVIGLPGETVVTEDGNVLIINQDNPRGIVLNEKSYLSSDTKTYKTAASGKEKTTFEKLGQNQYFLLGDNRGGSSDSRLFGAIAKNQILGREFYRSFPAQNAGLFTLPEYNINN